MPGRRYNYKITGGALKGYRARLLKLEPDDRATVQIPESPVQYGIPQKWLRRIKQPTTKPQRAQKPRRKR